ncbi:hypothetical protein [Streptomyces sp. NPDC054958]
MVEEPGLRTALGSRDGDCCVGEESGGLQSDDLGGALDVVELVTGQADAAYVVALLVLAQTGARARGGAGWILLPWPRSALGRSNRIRRPLVPVLRRP